MNFVFNCGFFWSSDSFFGHIHIHVPKTFPSFFIAAKPACFDIKIGLNNILFLKKLKLLWFSRSLISVPANPFYVTSYAEGDQLVVSVVPDPLYPEHSSDFKVEIAGFSPICK